jgi:hypothetical protein
VGNDTKPFGNANWEDEIRRVGALMFEASLGKKVCEIPSGHRKKAVCGVSSQLQGQEA